MAITGNGLKTLDVLQGSYEPQQAIRPRLADFEALVQKDVANEREEVYVR
jgi:threonine synthase